MDAPDPAAPDPKPPAGPAGHAAHVAAHSKMRESADIAKIAPAPMFFRTGIRLPISAQVKPPITSTALMVGPSALISPSWTSTPIRTARMR